MKLTKWQEDEIDVIYKGLLLVWRLEHEWNKGEGLEKCLNIRRKWPTEEDVEAFAYDIWISNYRRKERLLDEADRRHHKAQQGFDKCIMVTFNLLNTITVEIYKEIWESLKYWNNNLISGSKMRSEFFGRSKKFNPHIHIWVPMPKGRTVGKVRQACCRKFKKYSFNINVQPGNINTLRYVNGLKTELKDEAMALDAEYRKLNGIEETYQL